MAYNPCNLECNADYCYTWQTCPDCLGSGISQRFAINGVNAPNFYGLQRPVGIDKVCPTCGDRRRIITSACEYYDGDFED